MGGAATASLVKTGETAVGPLTDYLDSQKEQMRTDLLLLKDGHNMREKFSQAKLMQK